MEKICRFCAGAGKDPFKLLSSLGNCQVCTGSGVVQIEEPSRECVFCGGTGVYPNSRLTCTVCGGKGMVTIPEEPTECPSCNGTGTASESKMPCSRCRGIGVVMLIYESHELNDCELP